MNEKTPTLMTADDARLIRWFALRFVRPERWRLVATGLMLGISAGANAGLAWLIKPVFDKLIIEQNPGMLWILPPAIVAIVTVNGLAIYSHTVLMAVVEQNVTARIQAELFGVVVRSDLARLNREHTGKLIAQCMAFPGQLVQALMRVVTSLCGDLVMAVLLVGVMFLSDWQLALVTFAIVPIIVLGARYSNRRIRARAEANINMTARTMARLADLLSGMRLIKLQGAEEQEDRRFRGLLAERRAIAISLARARSTPAPIFEVAGGIGIGLVVLYAALRAGSGGPSFGTLASMMGALILAYRPLKRIAASIAAMQEGLIAGRAIRGLLEHRPKIVDRPGAKPIRVSHGAIRFDDVWFGYEPGQPVVKGISLEIEAGKASALVGTSGAGKTTLINLIPRLYDVDGGSLTLDGADVRDVTLASLRRSIAVVSQDTILFDDTIRANIAYGRPGASGAEIMAAAEAANAAEFIDRLPDGLDTRAGERGVRISGGQRQRLAIARAVLKDAPILLLDEATSSVDNESEALIQAAIRKLMAGRTVLLVAHRLSTVIGADRIHVLDDGRIVEAGGHDEMVRGQGPYARLYALQAIEHST